VNSEKEKEVLALDTRFSMLAPSSLPSPHRGED